MPGSLPRKAVAVVIKDSKVLLVRDRGKYRFSFPGGEIRKGEHPSSAAARALLDKTGLVVKRYAGLGSFKGLVTDYRVCLIEATGHVYLHRGSGLNKYIWWNMKSPVYVYNNVKLILGYWYENKSYLKWKEYSR